MMEFQMVSMKDILMVSEGRNDGISDGFNEGDFDGLDDGTVD